MIWISWIAERFGIRKPNKQEIPEDESEVVDVGDTDTIDDQVSSISDQHPSQEPRSELIFENLEPCLGPVDGNDLLFEIWATIRRHVVLPKPAGLATSLWVVHTYVFDLAQVTPILALLSPERRCGKTTMLALLDALAFRPLFATNITPAALFRTVEAERPTLLIDELDSQLHRNAELKNVLNAGHLRHGRVIRADGRGRRPRGFSVYCPKAVARIGPLPDTLHDRSIVVTLNRRSLDEPEVETLRLGRIHEDLKPLRQKALRWALDNREALREADPLLPEELHARAQDNWRPLVSIADLCGSTWAEGARKAAVILAEGTQEDPIGTLLLEDIRFILSQSEGMDRIPSAELTGILTSMHDRPWFDWPGPRGFSPHQLARLLRPFGIRPKPMWGPAFNQKGVSRGYFVKDFEEAFSRYLDPLPDLEKPLPPHPWKGKLGRKR